MKKVFMIALGLGLAVGLQAQEEASSSDNKFFIGGRAGFSTNDVKDGPSSSTYYSGPTFAFMLNEKMAIGINTLYTSTTDKQNNANDDIRKTSSYDFEPFFRYYFAGTGNLKIYGDAAIGFGAGTTSHEDNAGSGRPDGTLNRFGIGVRPGVQYWFNDSWSIASDIGLIGYSSQTDTDWNWDNNNNVWVETETTTSGLDINAAFSNISLSIFAHF